MAWCFHPAPRCDAVGASLRVPADRAQPTSQQPACLASSYPVRTSCGQSGLASQGRRHAVAHTEGRAWTTTWPVRPSMVSAMSMHALGNSASSLRSTSAAQWTRRLAYTNVPCIHNRIGTCPDLYVKMSTNACSCMDLLVSCSCSGGPADTNEPTPLEATSETPCARLPLEALLPRSSIHFHIPPQPRPSADPRGER